ncbi:hypothetical protein BDN72DRAFT_879381 [Pluteus cervinus]|uniref:Uncharacterized protein n=1 Tax=Pluteus cervinus TaxID=181527 RepID=A0ACD3AQ51_9AGAR|nr:hypothetical protein BDN72DRAFT_879381 [Pluteus cervinus]
MVLNRALFVLATYASATMGAAVYYCTNANWGGDCHHSPPITTINVCHNLEGGVAEFNDAISSFGPDQGLVCVAFRDFNCNNDQGELVIEWPGVADLSSDAGWNDAISSYLCNPPSGGPE